MPSGSLVTAPAPPPPDRPLPALRLVDDVLVARSKATPAAAPPTPSAPTTVPAALAALTGGTLATTPTGSSEVSFLDRATIDPPMHIASAAPPPDADYTTTTGAPALQPGEIAIGGDRPLHIDALFDRLLVRLRGELLDERERQGRLLGDGRW
jgi:hypothetical protein